ncbi:hypothetical protein DESA109040_22225 [Deinococcus saxicola]|uniref:type IV pilin protein n=1 Tax=Deinococcus saxicola TaxID=249406 RepID=UPI0039EFF3E5
MHPHTSQATQGFTLIELLTVLAIIAILAAILMPNFFGIRKRPHDVAAVQCARAIFTAQTLYRAENGTFEADITALGPDVQEVCVAAEVQVSTVSFPATTPAANGNNRVSYSANGVCFYVWDRAGSQRMLWNHCDAASMVITKISW